MPLSVEGPFHFLAQPWAHINNFGSYVFFNSKFYEQAYGMIRIVQIYTSYRCPHYPSEV